MDETKTRVMVLGATGNIGRPICDALLTHNNGTTFEVSALTRSSSPASVPVGVRMIRSSYDHTSLVKAFKGQDAVVCTIATSGLAEQQRIVDAAVEAGVKRFVPSDFTGADTQPESCLQFAPVLALKRNVAQYLQSKEGSGMSWTSFCNGLWFDWGLALPQMPIWSLRNRTFTLFDSGKAPFEAITLPQVGRAVAAALSPQHYASTENTYVYVHSFVPTQAQLLAALERELGKFKIMHQSTAETGQRGVDAFHKCLASGRSMEELGTDMEFQMSIVDQMAAGFFGRGGINQFGEKAKVWMDRLGLVEEDMDEVVKKVASEIKAEVDAATSF